MKHRNAIPTLTALGSAMVLALAGHAAQAETKGFEAWNTDNDSRISKTEWSEGFDELGVFEELDDNNSGIFEIEESDENFLEYNTDYDIDGDFLIERNEVANGLFLQYDTNDNEWLSEAEFQAFESKLQNLMM